MAVENQVNILLVENSATTTEMVKLWLEDGLSTPFGLTTTSSPADGISALNVTRTNVVGVDLNPPVSEGPAIVDVIFDDLRDCAGDLRSWMTLRP